MLRLGVIPTPGVAYLTGALGADFGVVLSASHNPAQDNGIKFFGRGGVKLPDEVEDEIEARLRGRQAAAGRRACRPAFGRVTDAYSEHEAYLDHLLATLRQAATAVPRSGVCGSSWTALMAPRTASARGRCAGRAQR